MLGDIVGRLATARRMPNMDGVAKVEVLYDSGGVGRVAIHVVAVANLGRPAVAPTVVCDDAIPLREEVEHLSVPVISAQRPAVVEDDRLSGLRAPVLVVDFNAIFGGDGAHGIAPLRKGRKGRMNKWKRQPWTLSCH